MTHDSKGVKMPIKRKISLDSYEHPELDISNLNGNAYNVMAAVTRALKKVEGIDTKVLIKQYSDEAENGDYDNLLRVSMEYVEMA